MRRPFALRGCLDEVAFGLSLINLPFDLLNKIAIGAGFDKIAIGLLLTKWPNWAGFDKMAIGA